MNIIVIELLILHGGCTDYLFTADRPPDYYNALLSLPLLSLPLLSLLSYPICINATPLAYYVIYHYDDKHR